MTHSYASRSKQGFGSVTSKIRCDFLDVSWVLIHDCEVCQLNKGRNIQYKESQETNANTLLDQQPFTEVIQ